MFYRCWSGRQQLIIFFLSLIISATSFAQYTNLDTKIEHWEATGQRDSFIHYQNQKAALAKKHNQLGVWAWTRMDISDLLEATDTVALRVVESAFREQWRQPASAEEWEPFLYLYAAQGWHLGNVGRIWQAAQALETSRGIYEQYQYEDCDAVDGIYKPLGNHYTRLGDNQRALAIFRLALTKTTDHELLAGLQYNIGLALWNQQLFTEAQQAFAAGLAFSGISTQKKGVLWRGQALVALDKNEPALALRYGTTALQLMNARPTNDAERLERATALRTVGLANLQLGLHRPAQTRLMEALNLLKNIPGRELAKTHAAMATVALETGQYQSALRHANQALGVLLPNFPVGQATALPDIGSLYEEITLSEALFLKANAAQGLFNETKDMQWLLHAEKCHTLAFETEQLLRKVLNYRASKFALQALSRPREAAAMEVAWQLWQHTGQKQWLQAGCQIAERGKAAVLLEQVQEYLIGQQLGNNDPRFEQLSQLQQNRSELRHRLLLEPDAANAADWASALVALNREIDTLLHHIYIQYPDLEAIWQPKAVGSSWDKGAAPDEMVLEYCWGTRFVEIFVVQGGVVQAWHRLPNDSLFQQKIAAFALYFSGPQVILNDPQGYQQAAFALYECLIPQEARKATRLCIVPDERLSFLPFEALVTQLQPTTLSKMPYLIRQQSVRYAWSMEVLQRQVALRYSGVSPALLAVAPVFLNQERGLATLNASRQEWSQLRRCPVTPLLESAALAASFLEDAPHYRLLHLATHAATHPQPYIEFADRRLLLSELYNLHLQADLVVLSACETGTGAYQQGEGVQSLANAFAQSGAACLISSLWAMNDKSTARLFNYFYQYLDQGTPTGLALHQAKLACLDDPTVSVLQQSPYYWAGMIMIGDNRSVEVGGVFHWYWLLAAVALLTLIGFVFLKRRLFLVHGIFA